MAKKTMTATGKRTTVANGVKTVKISQTGIRRELAAQRKAMGAAGVQRAMKNWGLKQGKGKQSAQKTGNVREMAAFMSVATANDGDLSLVE